jgi:NADH:ubiquinone oxidoreductase subunit C
MEIQREALVQTCRDWKEAGFDYLKKITAVDYTTYFEVVYIIYNLEQKKTEIITVKLDSKEPRIETVMAVYYAADWYEREMQEMFGIKVTGRGEVKRLLLEEWNGMDYPLRKSFEWGKDYEKVQ